MLAADALLQEIRVAAGIEHLIIVISLQNYGMALAEIMAHIFAGAANVGHHPYMYAVAGNHKAVRIGSIVKFRKGGNLQITNAYGIICTKGSKQGMFRMKARTWLRFFCNVGWPWMFFHNARQPPYVVGMLVGDENGFYGIERKAEAFHALFGFPAGKTGIDQDGFVRIAYIIAVGIAAGIEGGNE